MKVVSERHFQQVRAITVNRRYHCTMFECTRFELAQRVVRSIRKQALILPGQRVAVAVSGGADSVGLLRLLADLKSELGIVLLAAHFNHQLRGAESDGDEQFVRDLCRRLGIELTVESEDVRTLAAQQRSSLETAARRARYQFFESLLASKRLEGVATAHTLDDQAETVLMKFARGAGTRGQAGIYPRVRTEHGSIIRPLLGFRRPELEAYLKEIGQEWREDSSNLDPRHARNRVRREVMAVLEASLNPSLKETLAEAAEIARGEEEFWKTEIEHVLKRVAPEGVILRAEFLQLPIAVQRRVVLAVANSHELQLTFGHVQEICELAAEVEDSECSLPGEWRARTSQTRIDFIAPEAERQEGPDYEYPLSAGQCTAVPEIGSSFLLELAIFTQEYNPRDCLPAHLMETTLRVRNWRAGDRFQPAHSNRPKKIKELLQEMHIRGSERKHWPVIVAGDQVVWIRGVACQFSPAIGDRVLRVRETSSRKAKP